MAKRINLGRFVGNKYIKEVRFKDAVLWRTREISLNKDVCHQFKKRSIKWVILFDYSKAEFWSATVEHLRAVKRFKAEYQEEQFYFPIDTFKVTKINDAIENESETLPETPQETLPGE